MATSNNLKWHSLNGSDKKVYSDTKWTDCFIYSRLSWRLSRITTFYSFIHRFKFNIFRQRFLHSPIDAIYISLDKVYHMVTENTARSSVRHLSSIASIYRFIVVMSRSFLRRFKWKNFPNIFQSKSYWYRHPFRVFNMHCWSTQVITKKNGPQKSFSVFYFISKHKNRNLSRSPSLSLTHPFRIDIVNQMKFYVFIYRHSSQPIDR